MGNEIHIVFWFSFESFVQVFVVGAVHSGGCSSHDSQMGSFAFPFLI